MRQRRIVKICFSLIMSFIICSCQRSKTIKVVDLAGNPIKHVMVVQETEMMPFPSQTYFAESDTNGDITILDGVLINYFGKEGFWPIQTSVINTIKTPHGDVLYLSLFPLKKQWNNNDNEISYDAERTVYDTFAYELANMNDPEQYFLSCRWTQYILRLEQNYSVSFSGIIPPTPPAASNMGK